MVNENLTGPEAIPVVHNDFVLLKPITGKDEKAVADRSALRVEFNPLVSGRYKEAYGEKWDEIRNYYEILVNDAHTFLAMGLTLLVKDESVTPEEVIERWKKKTGKD